MIIQKKWSHIERIGKKLGLVLTGFTADLLGSKEQIAIVRRFLKISAKRVPQIIIDPLLWEITARHTGPTRLKCARK